MDGAIAVLLLKTFDNALPASADALRAFGKHEGIVSLVMSILWSFQPESRVYSSKQVALLRHPTEWCGSFARSVRLS